MYNALTATIEPNTIGCVPFSGPFVLWPARDAGLTEFLRWLTHTHTMRWHTHYHTLGSGHLYQGRFKAFPVQEDEHLYAVLRYVERNPLRAGLVPRAEDWPWSSLGLRQAGDGRARRWLHDWPLPLPPEWAELVNAPQTEAELEALRRSVARGCPYGAEGWARRVAVELGLAATLRPRGRPRKDAAEK